MKRFLLLALALGLAGVQSAHANLVTWTDWTAIIEGTPSVTGDIGGITVTYTGPYAFVQLGSGINYWTENGTPAPYTDSALIDNAPTASEMVALNVSGTHTITFSEAILNPVMAIVSMGQPSLPVSYDFDTDFSLISNGVGYWSYANGGLPGVVAVDDANDILTGNEFHGVIQFNGLVSQISWTSSPNEYWHGITFGSVAMDVPEPGTLALFAMGLLGLGAARRKVA